VMTTVVLYYGGITCTKTQLDVQSEKQNSFFLIRIIFVSTFGFSKAM
jgi:hypothetical protein